MSQIWNATSNPTWAPDPDWLDTQIKEAVTEYVTNGFLAIRDGVVEFTVADPLDDLEHAKSLEELVRERIFQDPGELIILRAHLVKCVALIDAELQTISRRG